MSSVSDPLGDNTQICETITMTSKPQTEESVAVGTEEDKLGTLESSPVTGSLEDIIKNDKPNTFGKGMLLLYLICFPVYFCSSMNGYDGSLMSSIYVMPKFAEYYGEMTSSRVGLMFAIYALGSTLGSFLVWICDYLGRKRAIQIGCTGIIVGTIITSTAKTLSTVIGGRFLMALFIVVANTGAGVYLVEVAPPHLRGRVAGFYNTMWSIGSIIASFTAYGCNLHHSGSLLSFRLPLWLQMLLPGIVLVATIFHPESPRFLVSAGKIDKAREFLVKYHANGDSSHPLVEFELAEMIASSEQTSLTNWRSFLNPWPLVSSRANCRRTFILVSFAWFGQFSGNNVSSYYFPTMLSAVGIESENMRILMNGIYSIVAWISSIVMAMIHDYFGRRKMFLTSVFSMSIAMAIIAGTTADYEHTGNKTSSNVSIAFIFIFSVLYNVGFIVQPLYPGEITPTDLRAKAYMISQVFSGIAGFVNQYAAPVAMQNIKYWFYVFYVFWDIIEGAVIYFFYVETVGHTIEEIQVIFESKNPVKASLQPILGRDVLETTV